MKKKFGSKILICVMVVSTLFVSDVSASTKSVTPAKYNETTNGVKLEKINVKYINDNIVITGKANGIKKVVAKYNKEKKVAKVKSGEFKLKLKYTKEKDIKLYGLNNQSEKITKNKTITSDKFVTAKPVCNEMTRTKKGITCEVNTEAGSLLIIKNNGKVIKKQYVDTSAETIFIGQNEIKGKKGNLVFIQKNPNKKESKSSKYAIIKVGERFKITY